MSTDLQIETQLRNVNLATLTELLRSQHEVKVDEVVPASRLKYVNGRLHIVNGAYLIDESGVTEHDAVLNPTPIFEDGLAERLDIPIKYLRRLRSTGQIVTLTNADHGTDIDVALLDANVNGWLQSQGNKKYLVRSFRNDDPNTVGLARSINSGRYGAIDHLDAITAALLGAKQAGVDPSSLQIVGDLSERRFRLRISAPEIAVHAPDVVERYRYAGRAGYEYPIVFAGVEIANSETGLGAFSTTPRIVFQVCDNGATVARDVVRSVHSGAVLDEGIVTWSADTQRKALELITAKSRDAIAKFLDVDYVKHVLDEIREYVGVPVNDAVATIERVGKAHLFSEEEQASILDCFIQGGDLTAGGVFQAVTAAAQNVGDPDRAAEFEAVALDVLVTAAAG